MLQGSYPLNATSPESVGTFLRMKAQVWCWRWVFGNKLPISLWRQGAKTLLYNGSEGPHVSLFLSLTTHAPCEEIADVFHRKGWCFLLGGGAWAEGVGLMV
jgi:hypothetical protein